MQHKHHLPSLIELRQERRPIKQAHSEARLKLSGLERFALLVTHTVGTMGFFFILALWTFLWLLWNLKGPVGYRFDPAPAFVIWLFSSNILQLVLLPLIMVAQNIEGKFSEERAQSDYEINQKAEREIELIIAHLENQDELLLNILGKIDKK